MKKKILIATEIDNIDGLREKLSNYYQITYFPNIRPEDINQIDSEISAIFTNPNNSKIYYGKETLQRFGNIEFLVTASTGTIHIDKDYLKENEIDLISISKSYSILNQITSTAEQAFMLTMAGLRNYSQSIKSVDKGFWDYSEFTGRQMNCLKIGVLGFGRLGKMYAHFAKSFGSSVKCCDPFKQDEITQNGYINCDIEELFSSSDVISIHIHADKENLKIINSELLSLASSKLILVNTSRGEVLDERALIDFLKKNKESKYLSDVIKDEHLGIGNNILYKSDLYGTQIFITPHCGGMTTDARAIAYHHAADLLLKESKTIT